MSESLKPRFAVDFDEIERQLAQTHTAPAQPAASSRNDPLAELARIVGQDDPFQSLLANDGSARQRPRGSSVEDLYAVRDGAAPTSPGHETRQPEPRFEQGHEPQQAYGGQEAHGEQDGYGAAYAQEYYDEGQAQQHGASYGQAEAHDYPQAQNRRSRRGLMAVGTVLAATVIGVGGAYVFTGGSASGSNGAPPLVTATNTPTKVQPQNPGGVEIPNQNKQIYERAGQSADAKGAKDTKVVNREEQPVDVKQAVRMNAAMADATGTAASPVPAQAQPPAGGLNLGEPRKVRTLSIRPDGTLINPEASNARPAPVQLPPMTLPPEARATPAHTTPAPVQVASAQAVPVPAKPAASTPVAAPTATVPSKPVPVASTPASGASPQNVASAQSVPAATTATDAVVSGYSVQLGMATSESAAGTTLAQLQRKFPDLNGKPSMIRKAEVNGSTIYRVRVGPLSKDEASSLCSKLQGQGAQCFVAKN